MCKRFLQSQLIQVMWLVSSHNPARVRLLNLVIVMMTLLVTFFFLFKLMSFFILLHM